MRWTREREGEEISLLFIEMINVVSQKLNRGLCNTGRNDQTDEKQVLSENGELESNENFFLLFSRDHIK